jgi:hypothetical protein
MVWDGIRCEYGEERLKQRKYMLKEENMSTKIVTQFAFKLSWAPEIFITCLGVYTV